MPNEDKYNPNLQIERVLRELGVQGHELEEMKQWILSIRKELSKEIISLDQKKLPRQLAIVNSLQAVQTIDMITDQISEQQGLLQAAMQGQEIHDQVAIIKAKVESLVVEGHIEARTINTITQQLKKLIVPEESKE